MKLARRRRRLENLRDLIVGISFSFVLIIARASRPVHSDPTAIIRTPIDLILVHTNKYLNG